MSIRVGEAGVLDLVVGSLHREDPRSRFIAKQVTIAATLSGGSPSIVNDCSDRIGVLTVTASEAADLDSHGGAQHVCDELAVVSRTGLCRAAEG
jgi:hypothetical protein